MSIPTQADSGKAPLKAPFPYFGGKRRVAELVWPRLGDVDNYVEPFCGSAAMLLARPAPGKTETLNDADCLVANFWRATREAPELVAEPADQPVFEADLHARHRWLMFSPHSEEFRQRMRRDPDYYDPKIAGWWCWGLCCWIGGGWCSEHGATVDGNRQARRPELGQNGQGVTCQPVDVCEQLPRDKGVVICDLAAGGGTCQARREWLLDWFGRLRDRLRNVRVLSGHWLRACNSTSTTTRLGLTGLFLDPPYPTHEADGQRSRCGGLYASDAGGRDDLDALRDEVLAYCRERGDDKQMRIAVCGYDTDGYAALEESGWIAVAWKALGGYANRNPDGNNNRERERIWFSPYCVQPDQERLLF